MDCSGDDDENCGGFYAMTVSKSSDFDMPDGYRGCYKDDRRNRVFDDYKKVNSRMTTKVSDQSRDTVREPRGLYGGVLSPSYLC